MADTADVDHPHQDEDRHQGERSEHGRDDDKKDGPKGDKKDVENDDEKDDSEKKPKSKLPIIILIVVTVIALIGGLIYWLMTRNQESTDDAYTEGNAVSIAPKVSGYVVENRVNDNIFVRAGDVLLKIDPRDYIVARDQAQANLDAALAQQATAAVDLQTTRVRAPANLSQAEAQVSVASLVKETIRTAEATLDQRTAQVEQARSNLAQAELNLSYTDVMAPQDGQITRRNVDLGTFTQAGQQVFYLVTRDVWIVANFKETQLDRMRVGQLVDVKVDAYSQLHLSGHIDSIQGGSGARFTAFPAENATGNFVKIVRRVPVKIIIDHGLEHSAFLPLGLSVEPTVYLK
jgi:membrane fusion protein (multidrug efflux system)